MLVRTLARLLTAAALLVASVAWAGWVFLHTAGDPGRSAKVAQAVLADPAARQELVRDIATPVADAANQAIASAFHGVVPVSVSASDPRLVAAVETTLADPRFAAEITTALQTAQANLLGTTPVQPVVINGDLAELAARNYASTLLGADVAARIPALHLSPISIDTPRVPALAKARSLAHTWDPWLWLAAVVGLAVSFLLGSRPRVLRAVGAWAVGSGLFAALLPRVTRYLVTKYVPSNAGLAQVAVRQVGGTVGAVGMVLVVGGAVAFVAGVVWGAFAKRRATPLVFETAPAAPAPAAFAQPAYVGSRTPAARRLGVGDATRDGEPVRDRVKL